MHKLFDLATEPLSDETEELYFRREKEYISYDTYFGVIPVRKLRKYTSVSELIFKCENELEIHTESGYLCSGNRILLSEVPESEELLYVKAKGSAPAEISVYAEGEHREVSPCIVICTYRRDAQVKRNVEYLLEHMGDDHRIILVDNASSIPVGYFKSEKVIVIHNENSGGSGGFGCGMKKAAEMKRFTHIILMDDDVRLDYISVEKMLGFLSFLKKEYADLSIAGSMLYMDKPTVQFEAGGYFSQSGEQTGYGYDLDLTERQSVLENEKEKNINYGAWWFMCMPVRYAGEGQFPAPFFIKYDDVEYSLRCRLSIITLSGVGVWHENFGGKYNAVQEYFNARNYLFLVKWHTPGFTDKKAYRTAKKLLLEKLCRQQYKMADAVLIAYEDFLKGEGYLTRLDYSHKLPELKKLNYTMLSEKMLRDKYGISFDEKLYRDCGSRRFKRYMQPLLYGHLIPRVFCRKLTITDVISDRKEHYFLAGKTLHYSVQDRMGYITKKSVVKFINSLIRLKIIHMKGIRRI